VFNKEKVVCSEVDLGKSWVLILTNLNGYYAKTNPGSFSVYQIVVHLRIKKGKKIKLKYVLNGKLKNKR